MSDKNPLGITELALRDAHQSLLATRMRIDDMLPIAGKLDHLMRVFAIWERIRGNGFGY